MPRALIATVGVLALCTAPVAAQPGATEPTAEPRTDEVWRLYDQAFAAMVRGDADDAGRLMHRILDDHADHPAAAAARDVVAALDRDAEVVAEASAPAPPERPDAGSRAELALFQTVHGIVLGIELCVAAECDEPAAGVLLALLGGGIGAGLSLGGVAGEVTPGKRALLNSGTFWGAFNAGMLLGITAPDDAITYGAAMMGGQLTGLAIGGGLHRLRPTSGQVGITNTVGMWSGAIALGVMGAAEADGQDTAIATMLVADAGLVAGALVARRLPTVSRAQSLAIDAGGIVGALAGASLGVMITDDVDRTTYATATAGAVIGLGIAAYLTRHWGQSDGPPVRAAIAPTDGGAVASVALDL